MLRNQAVAFLLVFGLVLSLVSGQEPNGNKPVSKSSVFESLVPPNRNLLRQLDQADRLTEAGRMTEAAQLLGGMLENTNGEFLPQAAGLTENSAEEPTLRQTFADLIVDKLRKLPKEAQESYAFQFETQAQRLLEKAIQEADTEGIRQVARKYFPTDAGQTATLLIGTTQYEQGDYAAAKLNLKKLDQEHQTEIVKSILAKLPNKDAAEQKTGQKTEQTISEADYLERVGWQLAAGLPSQNPTAKATLPILDLCWGVPTITKSFFGQASESLLRFARLGPDTFIPASQPLIVGNQLLTRNNDDLTAIDFRTGKRLWTMPESEYRLPTRKFYLAPITASWKITNPRLAFRLSFWHNRIAQQLSSDGERVFMVEGHDLIPPYHQAWGVGGIRNFRFGKKTFEDVRNDPGNTLTARNAKTGQVLWQVGKFPYVQKYIDLCAEEATQAEKEVGKDAGGKESEDKKQLVPNNRPGGGQPAPLTTLDDKLFSEEEKLFKETWFLGAPLPLRGKLYAMGENGGIVRLYVLNAETGHLLRQQPIASASSPMDKDFLRRTYGLTPSFSEGILLCPTGLGITVAVDAETASPIWCFSYVVPSKNEQKTQNRRNMMRQIMPGQGASDEQLRLIFSLSGWQVPCMMIDSNRVLIAPPDQDALYCLDLLTGQVLWTQKMLAHVQTLYVACIRNGKVYVVTPSAMLVIDMETGKKIPAELSFPKSLKPSGVGVPSGHHYFLPFSEGYLAAIDLDQGTLAWYNSSGSAIPAAESKISETFDIPGGRRHLFMGGNPTFGMGQEFDLRTPNMSLETLLQKEIVLGNLVGIKGRFFSQSPAQISCFDQREPLQVKAEAMLKANPDDPDGLFQQGRLLKSEGKLAESIDSLRRSLKAKRTEYAVDLLRTNLLEALRQDYVTWASAGAELESLAEFPEEKGEVLYVLAEGAWKTGEMDDFVQSVQKAFSLEQEQPVLVRIDAKHSALLHRALGSLIKSDPENKLLNKAAESIFQQIVSKKNFPSQPTLNQSWWEPETSSLYSMLYSSSSGIRQWQLFNELFPNTPITEKGKELLQEAYKRNRLSAALELAQNLPVDWNLPKRTSPEHWKEGKVLFQEDTEVASTVNQQRRNDPVGQILLLAKSRSNQYAMNQRNVPYAGSYQPALSSNQYLLEGQHEMSLVCRDSFGEELWRNPLPETLNSNYGNDPFFEGQQFGRFGMTDQTVYVKGCQHLLLFVRENTITAFDTSRSDSEEEAKILWTKQLTARLPNRLNPFADSLGQIPIDPAQISQSFQKESLFVSPQVVCYCTENKVIALDPMSGQTVWTREIPGSLCSILGDRSGMFLVFPDVHQVIAVDPASGKELANGTIPSGGIYSFETNIVFLKRAEGEESTNRFQLQVRDLRDLFDKRKRALLVSNTPSNTSQNGFVPSVPAILIRDNLTYETMMKPLMNGRFLATVSWTTKTLQIYDLLEKRNVLTAEIPLPPMQLQEANRRHDADFDVEFVDDKFLVLFAETISVNGAPKTEEDKDGKKFQRRFGLLNGVACRGIGTGSMMLYDVNGKECWGEPVKIEDRYRLLRTPPGLPVALLAVSVTDQEAAGQSHLMTGLQGIDKRTGKVRFSKAVPATSNQQIPLQNFYVTADPKSETISFITMNAMPNRIVKAVFTDEPNDSPQEKETETPKKSQPLLILPFGMEDFLMDR